MASVNSDSPTINLATRLRRLGGELLRLALLATIAFYALVLLAWRTSFDPSPLSVVLAAGIVVAVWAAVPRRWLGPRLAFAMEAIILLASVFAVGYQFVATRPEQRTYEDVLAAGGTVRLDYEWKDKHHFKTAGGWVLPLWCRDLFGDCMFSDVKYIIFRKWMSNTEFAELGLDNFRRLEGVGFHDRAVTDNGMPTVGRLRQIRTVGFFNVPITNAGVRHLTPLTELETLVLWGPGIDDGVIENLQSFENLKTLVLHDTNLTADGIARLEAALPRCQITQNVHDGER